AAVLLARLCFFDRLALHGLDFGAGEQSTNVNFRCGAPTPGGLWALLKGVTGGAVCRGGLTRAECNNREEKSEEQEVDGRFVLYGKFSPFRKKSARCGRRKSLTRSA